ADWLNFVVPPFCVNVPIDVGPSSATEPALLTMPPLAENAPAVAVDWRTVRSPLFPISEENEVLVPLTSRFGLMVSERTAAMLPEKTPVLLITPSSRAPGRPPVLKLAALLQLPPAGRINVSITACGTVS